MEFKRVALLMRKGYDTVTESGWKAIKLESCDACICCLLSFPAS
jgi:hypothetical protein